MADDRIWYRQDTSELSQEWLLEDLEPGARWAWMCLKAYIKVERPSQKRHSRAERLGNRAAARRWNVNPEDVEAMEKAAIDAGKLKIEGDDWVLTDIAVCAHEDTARRNKGADEPQTPANDDESPQVQPFAEICGANGCKPEQTGAPCHATVTDTGTVTDIHPSDEESAGAPEAGMTVSAPKLTADDGPPFWEAFATAMGPVGLCLCKVNAHAGAGPPTEKLVARHSNANQACRQLVDALGWEKAADLFIWCSEHLEGARSWSTIWGNYAGYLNQMEKGVSRVPRNTLPTVVKGGLAEQNSALTRELLDRMLSRNEISQEQYEHALSA